MTMQAHDTHQVDVEQVARAIDVLEANFGHAEAPHSPAALEALTLLRSAAGPVSGSVRAASDAAERPVPTEDQLADWEKDFAGWQPSTVSWWVEMATRGRRLVAEVRALRQHACSRTCAGPAPHLGEEA